MMPEHMRHVQESQRDFPGNADEYTFLPGRKGLRELRDGPSQKKQAAAFRAATEKYRAAENRQGSGNTNPVYSGQRRAHEAPARLFNPRIANPTDPKNPINTPDKAIPSMDVKVRNPPPPARFGKGPGKSDPLWDGKPGEKGRPIDPATNKPYTTEQPQSRVYLEPKKTDVFKSGGEAGPDKKTAGIGPPTEKQSLTRQPPRPQNGDHWERMKKAGEWKPPAPPAPPPQPESKDGSNKGQSTSKNVANPKFVPRPLDPKQKQSQEAPARLPNPDNKPDNPPPPPPSNPGNLADTKKTQPAADNAKKPDTNKAKPVNKTIPQSSRVLGSATKKDQPKPTPKTKPRKAAGGRRKLGRRGK
ncbi:hypothetical protein MCOR13_004071 [Pyricularia oryzae]|nr:hypothetical protein MCOR13_004071 [Pyricularia oryzae]